MTIVICHYCNAIPEMVNGDVIYPHRKDLHKRQYYLCRVCKAYVGTHKGTTKPLGILANATLRRAKNKAHAAFDPIWKNKEMSRRAAYKWLAKKLDIEPKLCHIGMFDIPMCERVIEIVKKHKSNNIFSDLLEE